LRDRRLARQEVGDALGPLIGKIAGVERRPIQFDVDGLNRAGRAGDLVDQACEGIPSASAPGPAERPTPVSRVRQ
jgi:hypothetical protein